MRLAQVFSVLKLRFSGGGKGVRVRDARDSRKAFGVEHLERRDMPAATGFLGQVQLIMTCPP